MNMPEWLKPGLYGALAGAAVCGTVGFSWGGWMTGRSAEEMANTLAQENVIAALVPVCLDISRADAERAAKLATIREAASFRRRNAVMETGWATMPGSDGPNRDLALACMEGLDLDAS